MGQFTYDGYVLVFCDACSLRDHSNEILYPNRSAHLFRNLEYLEWRDDVRQKEISTNK